MNHNYTLITKDRKVGFHLNKRSKTPAVQKARCKFSEPSPSIITQNLFRHWGYSKSWNDRKAEDLSTGAHHWSNSALGLIKSGRKGGEETLI
jgi:hypothetical protein